VVCLCTVKPEWSRGGDIDLPHGESSGSGSNGHKARINALGSTVDKGGTGSRKGRLRHGVVFGVELELDYITNVSGNIGRCVGEATGADLDSDGGSGSERGDGSKNSEDGETHIAR